MVLQTFALTFFVAPGVAPKDVEVVPITTTSVRVTWKPLVDENWNGDKKTGGYRIEYHQTGDFVANFPKEEIQDSQAKEIILRDLVRDKTYDVVVVAFNSQGDGPKTNPVTVYVGEAGKWKVDEILASHCMEMLLSICGNQQ